MIKAVIFDLDGTLANTLYSIAHFANQALIQCGHPPIDALKYRHLVGNGAVLLVKRMLNEVDVPENKRLSEFEKVYPLYNKSYDDDFLYLTEPYEGILPMLRTLYEQGILLGVVSNKPDSTTQKLVKSLFSPYISLCLGKTEGIPLKPDPAGVFALLDKWSIKPEECLYVGDTGTDMETGNRAKIYTIGVLWGFRDENELIESGADKIISNPLEIVTAVQVL